MANLICNRCESVKANRVRYEDNWHGVLCPDCGDMLVWEEGAPITRIELPNEDKREYPPCCICGTPARRQCPNCLIDRGVTYPLCGSSTCKLRHETNVKCNIVSRNDNSISAMDNFKAWLLGY